MRGWRLALLLAALVGIGACVSTNLAPIGRTSGPFVPENDGRQLWEATRQAEDRILPARSVYDDAALDTYLSGLAGRLVPAEYKAAGGQPIIVRVRRDPRLNASAMPHGTVILHTGVIARAENEAQLAGVLAHEITHVTHRHGVRQARAIENRRTATNVAAFIGLLALTAAAVSQDQRGHTATADAILQGGVPLLKVGLQLSYSAMVSGYSRDLERQADEHGMELMAAAGYDPREFKRFLGALMAESGDRGQIETFFYGSHPRLSERIETVDRIAPTLRVAPLPTSGQSEFDRRLVRVRVQNATYDAYLGRITLARGQMEKAANTLPPSIRPVGSNLLAGHLYVSAANGLTSHDNLTLASQARELAERAYRRAIGDGEGQAEGAALVAQAYKGLGLLYAGGARRPCEAKTALTRYLELARTATDASDIRQKIVEQPC
jgi:Zn-dependent protease with chaperone function